MNLESKLTAAFPPVDRETEQRILTKVKLGMYTRAVNPFDKSFANEYELALRIGDKRFGSDCKHEQVYSRRCQTCLRRVR